MSRARAARRAVGLVLCIGLMACSAQVARYDLKDPEEIRALGERLSRAGRAFDLGLYQLAYGSDPAVARAHFEAAREGNPDAALGLFIVADLSADEEELLRLGRSLVDAPAAAKWPPETYAYVLLRLLRSPLISEADGALREALRRAYRTGRVPVEAFVHEEWERYQQRTLRVRGPLPTVDLALLTGVDHGGGSSRSGGALGARVGAKAPLGDAVHSESKLPSYLWDMRFKMPEWMLAGDYEIQADAVLKPGQEALLVLRGPNALWLRGGVRRPRLVNGARDVRQNEHILKVEGDGSPLRMALSVDLPSADFGVALLPFPSKVHWIGDAAAHGPGAALHDWARAWLFVALDRPLRARALLAATSWPAHDLLAAASRFGAPRHAWGGDASAREEAFRLLTASLERMPGLALARLLLARWFVDDLEPAGALEHLQAGLRQSPKSPRWWMGLETTWRALGFPREAAEATREREARWPGVDGAEAEGGTKLHLPWERPRRAPRRPGVLDKVRDAVDGGRYADGARLIKELRGRGVPSWALYREGVRAASWPELLSLLDDAEIIENIEDPGLLELKALTGEASFWSGTRTPLDAIMALAAEAPGNDHAATILLQEVTVTKRALHLHRAIRLDSEESVRALGEWDLGSIPLLLRVRAIKPDHSVLFPESHGSSPLVAFPGLSVGDIIELEWVEDLASNPEQARSYRYLALQDSAYPIRRTCLTVLGPPDERPLVKIEDAGLWMFETRDRLADGVPFSRWCTNRVPRVTSEPDAMHAERSRAHALVYPWGSEAEGLRRFMVHLRSASRPSEALLAEAERLMGRHGGAASATKDRVRLVRAGFDAVVNRVREPVIDAWTSSSARTWSTGQGSAAVALVSLLRAMGFEVSLLLVNPLELERASARVFNALDFQDAIVRVALPDGRRLWLDPTRRPALFDHLPASLRGRPFWSFEEGATPRKGRSPEANPGLDELTVELDCERSCEVEVRARGSQKRWVDARLLGAEGLQVAEGDEVSGDAVSRVAAEWLHAILSDLFPLEEGVSELRWTVGPSESRLRGRVTLRPDEDGTLPIQALPYGDVLLATYASRGTRSRPFLLDSDLHVRVSMRFEDWRAEREIAVEEVNDLFRYELLLGARGRDDARFHQVFDVSPRIVTPELYPGLRQNLQQIARPPALRLIAD